jgi:tetratricopeptide (TPR) repeat protein
MGARVFLSAVSSEFGAARRELRHDFGTRRMDVATQEELSHLTGARTLLELLDTHIRDCSAVVCVIGRRSGAGFPSTEEASPYARLLPPDMPRASYTQWEFLLAREQGKTPVVCRPRPGHAMVPDIADADLARPDDAALQAAFVRHVEALGVPRIAFSDSNELCRMVMRQPWVTPAPDPPRGDRPIVLPYPSLGTLFKGRDRFMTRLRTSLTRPGGGTAAIAGSALHGLGGVGKTRTAVEYAWTHAGDYTALLLLDAETPEKLDSGLAALTGPLRLAEHAATEQAVRVEAALAWLNANPGWFLILDNIDSAAALDAAHRLLGRLKGGQVVLTSRLDRFPREVDRLDLDVLALDDAAAFLLEATAAGRRHAADDPAQARALAGELGQLALALEMAAATIEARRMSFAQYREVWRGNRARVVGWARPEITGYHHAVAEAWQTSVDQLGVPGRLLLERLAFLAPDPVPVFLLNVPVPGVVAEDGHAALDDLAAYSLVTREVDGAGFSVQRLVQDVTRLGLAQVGTSQARLTEALEWVNAAFDGDADDVRNWPRLDPLAPHAESVAAHADACGIAEPTGRLMNELGRLFSTKALHRRAEPFLRRTLAINEQNRDENDPVVAACLNNLAESLRATNRMGEAELLLRRSLAITEASLGKDHPDVAIRAGNLGKLLLAVNRPDEAELLMRRSLAVVEASLDKDHPNVATALSDLAMLLQTTNRPGEAEPLIRRALAIDEASFGRDHPTVAIVLNNLASLLQATNRRGEAEPLYRRALAIDEASLGMDHPNVATGLNNLASLLQATSRRDEAEPLMRRALAIFLAFQRDTGHVHPHRDVMTANYRHLLAVMGKSEADIDAKLAALRREAGLEPG